MEAKPADAKKDAKEKKSLSPKPDTKFISFEMYKSGKSINEIAQERNYTTATIEGHISHYIEVGEINIDDVLHPEVQAKVLKIINENTDAGLQRLKDLLPGVSYGEIRMMLAAEKYIAQHI